MRHLKRFPRQLCYDLVALVSQRHHFFDCFFLILVHFVLGNILPYRPLLAAVPLHVIFVVVVTTSSPSSFYHDLVCFRQHLFLWYKNRSTCEGPSGWLSLFTIWAIVRFLPTIKIVYVHGLDLSLIGFRLHYLIWEAIFISIIWFYSRSRLNKRL